MSNPQPPVSSPQPHLILASGSPRRRELLHESGYTFTVMPPDEDVECGVCSESGPAGLVAELAYRKAMAVRKKLEADLLKSPAPSPQPPTIILAADTVAECDGFILGKPRDESMARAMLTQLSGREHRVLTGVCLIPLPFREGLGEGSSSAGKPHRPADHSELSRGVQELKSDAVSKTWYAGKGEPLIRVAVTKLHMDQLSDKQLDDYIASGQWEGKAGAFGYQDRLGWVHIVEGSQSNVVGLPMELLAEMLAEIGAGSGGPGAGSPE